MLKIFSKIFRNAAKKNFRELMSEGAVIIDVRTKAEYQGGHIEGSVNIPLNLLQDNLSKFEKTKPVITCCASGMRSANAKNILESKGFIRVFNGGGWIGLKNKIDKQ